MDDTLDIHPFAYHLHQCGYNHGFCGYVGVKAISDRSASRHRLFASTPCIEVGVGVPQSVEYER